MLTGGLGLGELDGNLNYNFLLGYELYFGENGLISVGVDVNYWGSSTWGEVPEGYPSIRRNGLALMPGLHVHPIGNYRRVDLSIGLVPVVSTYSGRNSTTDRYSNTTTLTSQGTFGTLLARAAVTFHGHGRARVGLFLNGGPMFSSIGPTSASTSSRRAWVFFGFRIGGSW